MRLDRLPAGARIHGELSDEIPQEPRTSHVNRGKRFENDLIWTCRTYRARGEALIFKVPDPKKTAGGRYEETASGDKRWVMGPAIPDASADKSVDFVGLAYGHGYAFDAKENHDANRFRLNNVKPEQLAFLRDWVAAGGDGFLCVHQVDGRQGASAYLVPYEVIAVFWHGSGRDAPFGRHPGRALPQSIPVEEIRRWPEIKPGRGVLYDFLPVIPLALQQFRCEKAEGKW